MVRKGNKVIIIIIYLYGSADRGASVSEYLFYVFHVHNEHDNECNGNTIWTSDWLITELSPVRSIRYLYGLLEMKKRRSLMNDDRCCIRAFCVGCYLIVLVSGHTLIRFSEATDTNGRSDSNCTGAAARRSRVDNTIDSADCGARTSVLRKNNDQF